ncbi:MAG: aminotransferase class I/II-fold pyridoxal phosphate-dependent enzyme [Candidatus Thiodiazotropha sp.]|jgi:8-amino-7-oxononanoate synthase
MSSVEQAKSDLAARLLGARGRKKIHKNTADGIPAGEGSVTREPKRLTDHPGIAQTQAMQQLAKEHDMDTAHGGYFVAQRKLGNGRALTDDGRDMINFSSYDYLGLGDNLEIREAAREAISRYGTSLSATRTVGGEIDLYQILESEIADFVGTEAALLFVSGYLTNLAFLGYAVTQNDLVIHDDLSHNSMINGVRLSWAKRLSFRHNDPDHLDSMLKLHRNTAEVCLVMIEGVYSMDGDIVRLPEILEVARRHNCDVFIDEAHSFGVLGATGRGVLEYYGIEYSSDIILMNTVSKALASVGGYIACDKPLLEAVRWQASGASLYCAPMPPAQTAATLAAIRTLKASPELPARVREKAKLFSDELIRYGLNIGFSSGTAVVPILTGSSTAAVKLSIMLRERDIIAYAVLYPVVPDHMARVRFFVSAAHREQDLIETAAIVADCAKKAGVPKVPGF